MLENILVPLDGSRLAEAALPYAEAIARRTGAGLTLIRATRAQGLLSELAYVDVQQPIQEAENYLALLARDLGAKGFSVQTGVPFGSTAAEWILEEIDFRHADLVVMATHDRVGPERWLHGSVAESVVHGSPKPVMLVHGDGAIAQRLAELRPVLVVPLDGSELAEAALPFAVRLAGVLGSQLKFVGVVPRPDQLVAADGGVTTFVGSDYERLEAEASAYLETMAGRIGAEVALRYGDAAPEIAATAEEFGAAMVVMATHGRTGLVRSVLGSVAGGVAHRAGVPVVLIHPPIRWGGVKTAPSGVAAPA
jgi:nucleotide-binding universal stress UspA family protein